MKPLATAAVLSGILIVGCARVLRKAASSPTAVPASLSADSARSRLDTSAILAAMGAELKRSMDSLHLSGGERPYFLAYLYWDIDMYQMEATLGAVEKSGFDRMQFLEVDLRLGDYALDNSNFQGSLVFGPRLRAPLPQSNDPNLLRQAIWALTDARYKVAIEELAQKKAYLSNHRRLDTLPDFSRQRVNQLFFADAQGDLDTASIVEAGRAVSASLKPFPRLEESRSAYHYYYTTLYYVDSEGSRYIHGFKEHTFLTSLLAQADDGSPLWDYIRHSERGRPWFGREGPEAFAREMGREATRLARRLDLLSRSRPTSNYRGPVLLTRSAAGDLLHKSLLAPQARLRPPLGAQAEAPFLLRLRGRKYFPNAVSVVDRPLRSRFGELYLHGYYPFDHQAQLPQEVELIRRGKIRDFYRGKVPILPGERHSNGHWRYGGGFPGVVELKAERTRDEEELLRTLCRLCREEGIGKGLIISKVADDDALALLRHPLASRLRLVEAGDAGETFMLNTPVHLESVNCPGGDRKPVHGLAFTSLDSKSLRDITAFGEKPFLYEPQASFSALVPALLFSLMDLKNESRSQPRRPYLPPAQGSRERDAR